MSNPMRIRMVEIDNARLTTNHLKCLARVRPKYDRLSPILLKPQSQLMRSYIDHGQPWVGTIPFFNTVKDIGQALGACVRMLPQCKTQDNGATVHLWLYQLGGHRTIVLVGSPEFGK